MASNDVVIDRLISQDKLIEYCEQHKCGSVPLEKIKSEIPIVINNDKITKFQELLELAVSDLEDFAANYPDYACHFCKYNYGDEYCPEARPCFVWEHVDKVQELLGDRRYE